MGASKALVLYIYIDKFTWHKNVMGGGTIWERLDRIVANGEWRLYFQRQRFHI